MDEGCGATNAGAAEGVHPSRAGLELLPCVGAVPELVKLQACSAWPVDFTAWVSLGRWADQFNNVPGMVSAGPVVSAAVKCH